MRDFEKAHSEECNAINDESPNEVCVCESLALQAENARLRKALEEILDINETEICDYPEQTEETIRIARQALSGKSE